MIPHVVGEYRRYGSVKNYIQYDTVKFNHILHTKLGMSVHIDHTFAGTCFKGRFQNHPEGGGFDFLGGRGWTICNNLTEKGTILSNDISLPPSPPPELCKNYYSVSSKSGLVKCWGTHPMADKWMMVTILGLWRLASRPI